MGQSFNCFKAYDVRGRVPDELNPELAYEIGKAFCLVVRPKRVVVGYDARQTSVAICDALSQGLLDLGVDVISIGCCGTEQVYFATGELNADGGMMITASHNPADYNGIKFVREQAIPISADSGLKEIEQMIGSPESGMTPKRPGKRSTRDLMGRYLDTLLSFVDLKELRPLKIVVNPGNGCAGLVLEPLLQRLPCEWVKIYYEPDGRFPHGVPNPLLVENRELTARAVREHGADIGLAWDGDFDRCFFFDETGAFVDGYYIVGLLAAQQLRRYPGQKIVHDPRLTWNTIDVVRRAGGIPLMCKAGHAFIKERMRRENALFGGEVSAHYFFQAFYTSDSGMIPWLLILQLMSEKKVPFSRMVADRVALFPISGEINRKLIQGQNAIKAIEDQYRSKASAVDYTDGLGMEFNQWRFNLRSSNTEPLVRLNIESRGSRALVDEKTAELLDHLSRFA